MKRRAFLKSVGAAISGGVLHRRAGAAPPSLSAELPAPSPSGRLSLPLRQWVALELPTRGRGLPGGYGVSYPGWKHVNGAVDTTTGKIHLMGGDYAGGDGHHDDFRQDVWSLDLAARFARLGDRDAGWHLAYPYKGIPGQNQPKRPDWDGWIWDPKRNCFWFVPGIQGGGDEGTGLMANYTPPPAESWPDTSVAFVSSAPPPDSTVGRNLGHTLPNTQHRGQVFDVTLSTAFTAAVDFTVQENAPALGRVTLTKIQGGRLPPAAKVFFCMNLNYPRSRRDIEPGVRVPSRLFYGDDPATSTYPGYLYNHVMQFAPTPQPDGFGRWRDVSDSVGVVGDGPRTAWKCIYDEAKDKLVHVWSGPNAPPSGVQAFNCTTATWEASTEFGNADDYRAPGRRALVLGHSHPGYDPVNRGVYYLESYAGPNGRCRLWRLNLENNAWVKPAYTLTYLGLAPGTIQQTPLPNEFMLACWDTTNHVLLWWNYHDTSTPTSELFAYTPAAPPADSGTWSADLGTVVTQANDLCGGLSHPAVAAGFKVWGRTMLYDPRQNCVWFGGDTIGLAHERNHFFLFRYGDGAPSRPHVAVGQWYRNPRVKGSRIADVLDRISPQGNGPFAIVAAWTSAAYDATRDRVLKAACGGHADWPGNEVFAFAPSTGQWSLLRASSPGSVYGARGIVSASGSSPSVVTTTTAHGFRDGLFVAVASSTNVFLGAGPVTVTGYPANQFAIASLSGDPAGGAAQPADDPYTDGNPSSVHTYGAQAYIPPPYDYLLRGPGARWPDGNSTSKMWGYRQAANTWARLAPIAPGGIQASHTHFIWDPITAKLYAWYGDTGASGFSYYSSYDPALDTWTLLRKGDWAARVDWLTAAFDSKRRRFLLAGLKSPGIPVIAYRPILGGAVTEATVDRSDVLAEFCALSAPGFEYDANSDRFIGWAARTAGDGRSTFVIDPSTSPWKIVKNTRNTGDEPPVTRNGNGVLAYKHFLSIGDGLMLLIPPTDIADDTYYYRVSASTSA